MIGGRLKGMTRAATSAVSRSTPARRPLTFASAALRSSKGLSVTMKNALFDCASALSWLKPDDRLT